ncbi:MAG: hypothetical protein CL917_09775 [Deltaproteobacteria bacterium]|nr:hypothetical protein [Deltaproteobacteria bacterium]
MPDHSTVKKSPSSGLTPEDKNRFLTQGYLHVPGAIPQSLVTELSEKIDTYASDRSDKAQNRVDIFGMDRAFLELTDLDTILPKIQGLLGDNIWINHSHINRNPTTSTKRKFGYSWHRDGGAVIEDLPSPVPLVFIKVGFYLSDLSEPNRGQTFILPGSHHSSAPPPPSPKRPAEAIPLNTRPGDAILFDFRTIHSLQSPNHSDMIRRAVFIQYGYRWIQPFSDCTFAEGSNPLSPVRRQLLGLTTTKSNLAGTAADRSGVFYPTPEDIPLHEFPPTPKRENVILRAARRAARTIRRRPF